MLMEKQLKIFSFLLWITYNESIYGAVENDGGVDSKCIGKKRSMGEMCSSDNPAESLKIIGKKRLVSATSSSAFMDENTVQLKKGRGSRKTGGGDGGYFWWIHCCENKVGRVFINFIDDEKPIGNHASIQVFLNKSSQGKHIGRWAYKKACEQSCYDEVYAHIGKGNKASIKSAEAAGFLRCFPQERQVVMKWVRMLKKKI